MQDISHIPEVKLSHYNIDPKVLSLVPPHLVEKYTLIPLFKAGKTLTLAMADPKNVMALDEVREASQLDISVVRAAPEEIKEAISDYYGISAVVEDVVKSYMPEGEIKKAGGPTEEEAPIVKLVNVFITQAIREKASDIHIEPEAKDVRVRYRVDGLLREETKMPSFMQGAMVSRIKVLGGMDIAESRVPQDGRFEVTREDKTVDLRVSTFPSAYGEKVVLRILDKSTMLLSLSEIGFSPDNFEKFKNLIHKPHGIILVTGPTGSGKTTTLYAALREVNSKELNVVTVEDPIEYELEGITQSQVNLKAGLTFASALRSILRQDPDIILIGEIRDLETATISIQAALTGHLVFSTLHTNDAPGALVRLIDMGIEPFLVSSSLEAILAQRLVRTICKKCKEEHPAPPDLRQLHPEIEKVYAGKGCKVCKNSGYKGRTGIYELLLLDDQIRKMIVARAQAEEIRKYAVNCGVRLLYNDGIEKVKLGVTTMDEVLRVTELERI